MSYSGTVGLTTITVQSLIDHGARSSGKLAEELTNEQVRAAKDNLWMLLSNLANRGIQYWCIAKHVVGLDADKYEYELPIGTIDVLNSNYRTVTRWSQDYFGSSGNVSYAFDGNVDTVCQQTAPNGNLGVYTGIGSPVYMATVGILPGANLVTNIQIQASADNVNWVTVYAPGVTTWEDGVWLYYDLDPSQTLPYWRIVETGGATLSVRELVFGSAPIEIPLARLNRDDYTNLPNKNFTNNRPLQFWFNRTIPRPTMVLWPTPSDPFPQLVAWCHRQIQDVGALDGQLEMPDRWLLATKFMLAHQMSIELPGVPLDRIQYLEGQSEKYWSQAEQEERDKSPIYLVPNISVYTR